jgi:hypothetical protein
MSGLKMVKSKVVAAKVGAKATIAVKKNLPAVPDQDPVTSANKGGKTSASAKAVKAVKVPKEKAEKVLRVTRTGRMGELIKLREHTDVEMYEILDAEFGEGKKYLATYRHNLNVKALEADPKFKPYVRMIRGQDGTIGEFVAGASSTKKEKKAETKAKITLAVSKLPK